MSITAHLNLARKWRSKQFDQIIGQDLSVRMLKNSLYLDQLFPVYLFSGQRGCGKTTTARVFASAINCHQVDIFRAEPKKTVIPCLQCQSCRAMLEGKHPDFIEIDAASHTGVDNVRNIIDAASLMPIIGRKKIYLIDEAHMLSKAAFNAFLKILEEPPASVVFILATTDPQKIIETVRSRCFQIFFKAIDTPVLLSYLQDICTKENIVYEDAGLELIIRETEGSARDALNMLEAVRFSATSVTQTAVFQLLGYVQEDQIIRLLEAVLSGKQQRVLEALKVIDSSSINFVWQSFLQLLHATIWIKHDIKPEAFMAHLPQLEKLLRNINWLQLHAALKFCYDHEKTFLKTTHQRAFFEMILLQLSAQRSHNDEEPGSGSSSVSTISETECEIMDDENEDEEDDEQDDDEEEDISDFSKKWHHFVQSIVAIDDPLLASIFKQGHYASYDQIANKLTVIFSKRFAFFQDLLEKGKHVWFKLMQQSFNEHMVFEPLFSGEDQEVTSKKMEPEITAPIKHVAPLNVPKNNTQPSYMQKKYQRFNVQKAQQHLPTVDIKNKEQWQKVHLVLEHFPGTVHEMREKQS